MKDSEDYRLFGLSEREWKYFIVNSIKYPNMYTPVRYDGQTIQVLRFIPKRRWENSKLGLLHIHRGGKRDTIEQMMRDAQDPELHISCTSNELFENLIQCQQST